MLHAPDSIPRAPAPRRPSTARTAALAALLLALAACATPEAPAPAPGPAALTRDTPEQMVTYIRNVADNGATELTVQPIRDPAVEDLRKAAQQAQSARNYAEAAKQFDAALAIAPDDPALLQERAETAILLKDFTGAETRAKRAWDIGSRVGPLCRRHWATVQQAKLATGDADGAAAAKREVDACKVEGVNRF